MNIKKKELKPNQKIKEENYITIENINKRFRLADAFLFKVPETYDHNTWLSLFKKENYGKFVEYFDGYIDKVFTDKNFGKMSKLIQGKTYLVKVFEIEQRVEMVECIMFQEGQKVNFVGPQGLFLLWQDKKEKFPLKKFVMSFASLDFTFPGKDLGKDQEYVHGGAPYIYQESQDHWWLGLSYSRSFDKGNYIIFFCDE